MIPHPRDRAFSLEIVGRNEDPTNPSPLKDMIEVNGNLILFKTNSVFAMYTADGIDPDRKHPQAKGTYKQIYSIGTSSPFISRTIIQSSSILKKISLIDNKEKTIIQDTIFNGMKEIINCHMVQSGLEEEICTLLPICDAHILESKASFFIHDFPQVKNLDNRVSEFFLSAKRFLQTNMTLLEYCLDKPNNGVKFHKDIEWAKANKYDSIAQLIENDNMWMSFVVSVRNIIEHPNECYHVEARNFTHTPENKFFSPSWRYKLHKHEQIAYTDVCRDMHAICVNLLEFSEELFFMCIDEIIDKRIPWYFYRIPEDKINHDRPIRYDASVDLDRFGA